MTCGGRIRLGATLEDGPSHAACRRQRPWDSREGAQHALQALRQYEGEAERVWGSPLPARWSKPTAGTITVRESPLGGARFEISIPVHRFASGRFVVVRSGRGTCPLSGDLSAFTAGILGYDGLWSTSMQNAIESKKHSMDTIKVYLIDDQAMIRAAIKNLLSQRDRFEVVGDNGDARKALGEIPELRPDVVLLGHHDARPCPDSTPSASFARAAPKSKVVMLTHHEGQTFVEQALRAGADGYPVQRLRRSRARSRDRGGAPQRPVRVTEGLGWFGDSNARLDGGRSPESEPTEFPDSARARSVSQLLAVGKCNKEVARDLNMSLGTAKKHRENLQRKLDCHSAAELARLAIREGLLST